MPCLSYERRGVGLVSLTRDTCGGGCRRCCRFSVCAAPLGNHCCSNEAFSACVVFPRWVAYGLWRDDVL